MTGGEPWKPIPTRGIATPRPAVRLPTAYDVQPTYEPQKTCQNTAKPGAVRLRDLLLRTYPGSGSYGISTGCTGRSHVSEHLEGRAFDWKVDITNPKQKAQAETFLFWLTAVDGAMAKRLGHHVRHLGTAGSGARMPPNAAGARSAAAAPTPATATMSTSR